MSDGITPETLQESQELLQELFEEVKAQEGTLAGGTALGIGGQALEDLSKTEITFGNPHNELIRLTPELFEEVGVELKPIHKSQMQSQYDFYYMTLNVSMVPRRGVQFQRLECKLDFGPKGAEEPIIHSFFPTSEWKKVLHWGGGMNLGLNGNLEWSAGVDTPEEIAGIEMPAHVKSNIANKNGLKAFIVMHDFLYKLGRTEIAATGEGNSLCFWRIEKPDLKEVQTVKFGVIFKVPQGTTTVDLIGKAQVEPNFNWLFTQIENVFDALTEKLQALFQLDDNERKGKQHLPVGAHEKWTLTLPQ